MDPSSEESTGQSTHSQKELDRRTRCWKRWGALAGVGGAILMAIAGAQFADRSKTVEAEQFILRAKDGSVRAKLAIDKSDNAYFHMFDPAGHPRLGIGLNSDGTPTIYLADCEANPRLRMDTDKDGTPTLSFSDRKGRPRTIVGTQKDGSPDLSLYDEDRTVRLFLSGAKGAFGLTLLDQNGKVRIHCGVSSDGEAELTLLDKGQNEVFHVPKDKE